MKSKRDANALEAIRVYVREHGFGSKTPPLQEGLKADVFKLHYYDKKQLMEFCRTLGMSTSGTKPDLNQRIEKYLRTGQKTIVVPISQNAMPDSRAGLRPEKRVVNYKSDSTTRDFFSKHIPSFFGFSAYVLKWTKEQLAAGNPITYADVLEEHKSFLNDKRKAKAKGEATKVAHDSCQFNQFYIDYSHDSEQMPHTAKEAWVLVRDSAGDKTYQRYKDKISEISQKLASQAGENVNK